MSKEKIVEFEEKKEDIDIQAVQDLPPIYQFDYKKIKYLKSAQKLDVIIDILDLLNIQLVDGKQLSRIKYRIQPFLVEMDKEKVMDYLRNG